MEKGNKTVMIIIIVLLVILLASIAVLSVFAINTLKSLQEGSPATPTEKIADRLPASSLTEIPLEEKTINLRTSENGSNHVIRLQVTINVDNSKKKESEDFIAVASESKGMFESIVVEVTRGFTAEEINSPGGTDILSEELLVAMNEAFDTNLIYSLSFVNLFVQ